MMLHEDVPKSYPPVVGTNIRYVRVQRTKAERRANRLAGVSARKAARREAMCK